MQGVRRGGGGCWGGDLPPPPPPVLSSCVIATISETHCFAKFLAIILLLAAKEVEKRLEETV